MWPHAAPGSLVKKWGEKPGTTLTPPVLTGVKEGEACLAPQLPIQLSPGTEALGSKTLALGCTGFMKSSNLVTDFIYLLNNSLILSFLLHSFIYLFILFWAA